MIDAKELRIGNWIEIKPPPNCDSGICMVEVIKRSSASLHCESEDYFIADVPYEKIKPIELTPSILEQCGFEESTQTFFIWYTYGLVERQFRLDYSAESEYHWVQGHISVEIKYLHQLQNLYFSLFSEELNFQPQTQKQEK